MSIEAIVLGDGLGEGAPGKLLAAFQFEEGFVAGLRTAQEAIEFLEPAVRRSEPARSIERLEQACETLDSEIDDAGSHETEAAMWIAGGRNAALRMASGLVDSLRESHKSGMADAQAPASRRRNSEDLSRKIGDDLKEISYRLSTIERKLRPPRRD